MDIRVLVHLEAVPGEARLVWWAESPDVPGFSALDDDLPGLMVRTEIALGDQLSGEALMLHYELVSDEASTDNPAPETEFVKTGADGLDVPRSNPGQDVAITARPLVPAA
jgi:hypothetical protein